MAADPSKTGPADPREDEPAAPREPEPAEPRSSEPEPRSTEQIRLDISTERQKLTRSLSDLREDVHSARRIPLIVGGALVAGVAAFVAVKAVRGRDGD